MLNITSKKDKTCQTEEEEPKFQEHEYVYFLLKITEDILRNNLNSEDEISSLFERHIAANKDRLNEDRMRSETEHLKNSLTFPLKERCNCKNEPETENVFCKCSSSFVAKKFQTTDIIEQLEKELCSNESENWSKHHQKIQNVDQVEMKKESEDFDKSSYSVPEKLSGKSFFSALEDGCDMENIKEVKKTNKREVSCQTEPYLPEASEAKIAPKTEDTEGTFEKASQCVDLEQGADIKDSAVNKEISISLHEEPSIVDPSNQSIKEEYCYCGIALQKNMLKIKTDDKDEEYILIDGPIYLPKSILETNTVKVLIRNVPSMLLNVPTEEIETDENEQNLSSYKYQNLNTVNQHFSEEELDYDLKPEREKQKKSEFPDDKMSQDSYFSVKDDSKSVEKCLPSVKFISRGTDTDEKQKHVEHLGENKITDSDIFEHKKKINSNKFGRCKDHRSCTSETCPKILKYQKTQKYNKKVLLESATDDTELNNKYHFLLKDVSTSTSSLGIVQQTLSKESELVQSSEKASMHDEYKLLLDEQYEVEQHAIRQQKLSLLSTEGKDDLLKPFHYRNFDSPLLRKESPKEQKLTYPLKKDSDAALSIPEKRTSQDQEVQRNMQLTELPPSPTTAVKQSIQSAVSLLLKPHDAHKVRYSLTRDKFDQQHQELLAKLDALPRDDEEKERDENVAAINEQMQEFRKVDKKDGRRFDITDSEHFEIRRMSLGNRIDEDEEEDIRKKNAKRNRCCGGLGKKRKYLKREKSREEIIY